MQFNHANFTAADVGAATRFFVDHFGFQVLGEARSNFVVMEGEGGFILNVMAPGKTEIATYPKNFHVGFFVGSVAEVRAKHEELVQAGYDPGDVQELRRSGSLTTTFYCPAPGGFLVEVASNAG